MLDTSFYELENTNCDVAYIAEFVHAHSFVDKGHSINSVASIDTAGVDDLSFFDGKFGKNFVGRSGILLAKGSESQKIEYENSIIFVNNPKASFANFASKFFKPKYLSDTDFGENGCEDGVHLGRCSTISNSAKIGRGTRIGNNVTIGAGVCIGRDCIIEAGAVINCAYIGDRVKIGANSVIGKAGFGVVVDGSNLIDVPHFGRVIIQDDVTIGALCTIDRGAFADTIIGINSKIDNHCHIGHNSKLGQGVVIAAYGGISGSVEIGNFVMMGGRVGVGDHFKIGDGAKIAAGSAVLSDVPAGQTFAGYPAKSKISWMKESIAVSKLVEGKKRGDNG